MPDEKEIEQIIEAILFSSPQVVSFKQLFELTKVQGTRELRNYIDSLNQQYEMTGRVFRIHEIGSGLQMRTEPEFRIWIQKLEPIKPIKLTLPTLETLSIIAYKQPITRASIEFIRGVDSSYTLRTLLQRKLIKIAGKEAMPGRPILYGTSQTFLEVFGLKNLTYLPDLKELDMEEDEKGAVNELEQVDNLEKITELNASDGELQPVSPPRYEQEELPNMPEGEIPNILEAEFPDRSEEED